MTEPFNCQVCGASLSSYVRSDGGYCNKCGMKYKPGGMPAFTPPQLMEAAQKGEEGYIALSNEIGMPVGNIKQVEALFKAFQEQSSQQPASIQDTRPPESSSQSMAAPSSGMQTMIQRPQSKAETHPPQPSISKPASLASGDFNAKPRLKFGYDDAFYLNEAGEVMLSLDLTEARGDEQDIKLTLEGDIARPFNVNMQDLLGREKRIVVTPTSFPTSRLVVKLSCFDQLEEPHCWIGETIIRDVERPVEQDGNQQVVISSTFQGGEGKHIGDSSTAQNINLEGLQKTHTMKRRRLEQPVRCEVHLRPDDVAERELATTSRALRIKAREKFARAENRVRKGKLEKANDLIREVEDTGFLLREAQKLKSEIERGLSDLSLKRGQKLFEQGKLKESHTLLSERKLLVYNQGIIDLLIEIEDISDACTDALALIEEGELDEAEENLNEILQTCPKYERAQELLANIADLRKEKEQQLEQAVAAEEAEAEAKRQEEERQRLAKIREDERKELEDKIYELAESKEWREVFRQLATYVADNEHDVEVVQDIIAGYRTQAQLRCLAKFIPPGDDDPHLLILAEPDLPVGRHERNAIILNDSSCRTGRSHGRITLNEPGKWMIQRWVGDFGKSVHPISVNDEDLNEEEALEIIDDDLISFSDIVKLKARAPEDAPVGAGVELSVHSLAPEDEEYKNLIRWTLMDRAVLVGGTEDCHVKLPSLNTEAFVIRLAKDIFWIEPAPSENRAKVLIGEEALEGARPLLHNEKIFVDGKEFLYYQLTSFEELWMWDDELDERELP